MASNQIPVFVVSDRWWNVELENVARTLLPPDARVIVASSVTSKIAPEDIRFTPAERRAVGPIRLWSAKWADDTADFFGKKAPWAGKFIEKCSTVKLYGIRSETRIFFQRDDGQWVAAIVGTYPRWREQERLAEKVAKKAAYKQRKYLRQPTALELITLDSEIDDIE